VVGLRAGRHNQEESMSDKMEFYDGLLRLAGNVLNEVHIRGVSAAEVIMLQSLHGEDAVTNLRKVKRTEVAPPSDILLEEANATEAEGWSDRVIRAHLRRKYNNWQDEKDKVTSVFGNSMVPLPKAVDMEVAQAKADSEARMREQIERDVRARIEKEYAEKAAAATMTPAQLAAAEKAKAESLRSALE
jgi:hypothetical protein